MVQSLTWVHKVLSFMPPVIPSIYIGTDDVLRPSIKLYLRPNNKYVAYLAPDTYESQYQMPHSSLSPQKSFT